MSAVVPPEPLYSATPPSGPTGTTTVLATVDEAMKVRLDTVGRTAPSAYAVM